MGAALVSDQVIDTFAAAGTIDDVTTGLRRFVEAGIALPLAWHVLGPDRERALGSSPAPCAARSWADGGYGMAIPRSSSCCLVQVITMRSGYWMTTYVLLGRHVPMMKRYSRRASVSGPAYSSRSHSKSDSRRIG